MPFQAFLPEVRKTSTTARTSIENVTSRLNLQLTLLNLSCFSGLGKKKKKKVIPFSTQLQNRPFHINDIIITIITAESHFAGLIMVA